MEKSVVCCSGGGGGGEEVSTPEIKQLSLVQCMEGLWTLLAKLINYQLSWGYPSFTQIPVVNIF